MRKFALIIVAAFSWLVIIASPSWSLCRTDDPRTPEEAMERSEQRSVFVGTVKSVSNLGRFATVEVERTTKGPPLPKTVEVRAGPDDPNVGTSNDRRFEVGARYEFYPRNDRPPFNDDECTATRKEVAPGKFAPASMPLVHSDGDAQGPELPIGQRAVASHAAIAGGVAVILAGVLIIPVGLTSSAIASRYRKTLSISLAVCLLALAMSLKANPAEAGHNIGGQSLHWGRGAGQAQATPGVHDQVGAQPWTGLIQQTINSWNPTLYTEFSYIYDGPPGCDGQIAGMVVCLRAPNPCPTGDFPACAWYSWHSGNHFSWVNVKLNPNLIPNNDNARRQGICQEMGHGLGLDHRGDNENTCMDATIGGCCGYHPVPDGHDYDQANAHSNHTH